MAARFSLFSAILWQFLSLWFLFLACSFIILPLVRFGLIFAVLIASHEEPVFLLADTHRNNKGGTSA